MFLPPFTILPFTTGDAVVAGRSRGYLGRQGTPIGPHDVQIAAQGLSQGLTVVTHNMDASNRVSVLQFEDWARWAEQANSCQLYRFSYGVVGQANLSPPVWNGGLSTWKSRSN